MLRDTLELNSGLVKFRSKESATSYLETLLQYYKARQEEYGQQLAELLRGGGEVAKPKESKEKEEKREKQSKKEKNGQAPMAKGWAKVGSLPVNTSDTRGALAQVTLRIVDDYKGRVEKVTEGLKSFKDVDTLSQPGTKSYTLFIYKGVPEAVIVEDLGKRVEVFAFSASFKAV